MLEIEYELIKISLKKTLKQKNITYAQLAKRLSVSEIKIKRIFSNNQKKYADSFFDICQAIDISFFDLVEIAKMNKKSHFSLTLKQENFFCKNIGHFAIFREMYRKKPMSEIKRNWKLSQTQLLRIIFNLEKLNLIEIYENNKIIIIPEGVLELAMNSKLEILLRKLLTTPFLAQFDKIIAPGIFLHNSEIEMSDETFKLMDKELRSMQNKYCALGCVLFYNWPAFGVVTGHFSERSDALLF